MDIGRARWVFTVMALPLLIASGQVVLERRNGGISYFLLVLSLSQAAALLASVIIHSIERAGVVRLILSTLLGGLLGRVWSSAMLLMAWSLGAVVLVALLMTVCVALLVITIKASEHRDEPWYLLSLSSAMIAAMLTYDRFTWW